MSFSTLLYYLAPIIGFTTLLIGVSAAVKPQAMSSKFGIAATGATLPYVISTGMRDVFMGLTVFILFSLEQWTALGAVNLAIGLVAISDCYIVRKYGDRKNSYVHAAGAVAVIVYGLLLLR